jgi:hypothetical protein
MKFEELMRALRSNREDEVEVAKVVAGPVVTNKPHHPLGPA